MKPTKKQKEVIETCITELEFMSHSNDIASPTHVCSISTELNRLVIEGEITEQEETELNSALLQLYNVITKIG